MLAESLPAEGFEAFGDQGNFAAVQPGFPFKDAGLIQRDSGAHLGFPQFGLQIDGPLFVEHGEHDNGTFLGLHLERLGDIPGIGTVATHDDALQVFEQLAE